MFGIVLAYANLGATIWRPRSKYFFLTLMNLKISARRQYIDINNIIFIIIL